MIYDPATDLLLPIGAKARYARFVLTAGGGRMPTYPDIPLGRMSRDLQRLARRQWIAFGTGPAVPRG